MHERQIVWLVPLVVFALVVVLPAVAGHHEETWAQLGVGAVGCAALLLRIRWPLPVLVVTLACALASMALTALVFPAALMVLVALVRVGMSLPVRVVTVCTAVTVCVVYFTVDLARNIKSFDLISADQLGWFVAASAAGVAVANQRRFVAEAEERALRAEQSREAEAHRRVSEERLRIAQELHDVIGHSIAVINVQAGTAAHVIDVRPKQVRQSLELIRQASSSAMEEIRTTLGLLRTADPQHLPVAPAPGLDDVSGLVDGARAGGLRVCCVVDGPVREVPHVVGTTVYRLVQEALTNAVKYAGAGANVEVRLEYEEHGLRLSVEDDGAGTAAAGPQGSGLGLRGMRERVEAVGGTLEVGRRRPRGFRVAAQIPTEAP
ncbi:sensor histidine kinase [Streptomyces sp. NPDC006393]|uniref:sensor histidine kinase n=1 Tax=Streptomyces sp. NPDC006393 TaxID=3156763 RepID=UPI0033FB1F8B